ncbi:MAG: tetratricopeptide repeat-containing protein kinase family protein, partial [Myxococcota bacterium]
VQSGVRAKVIDFGLARTGEDPAELMRTAKGVDTPAAVTQTGAVLGTPAYMAPEQFLHGDADARSDQFAFCVLAWEALTGARPFRGRNVAELAENTARGVIDDASDKRIARRLRTMLLRGLAAEPSERHPDMGPLVTALGNGRRGLARGAAVGFGALGIAGAAWALGRGGGETADAAGPTLPAEDSCAEVTAPLDTIWNPERRAVLRRGIEARAPAFGAALADRVEVAVQGWGDAWREQARYGCEGEGAPPGREPTAAQRCLEVSLGELDAALSAIATLPEGRLARVLTIVDRLPSAARCGRRAFVETAFGSPPSAESDRARVLHREAQARLSSGQFVDALQAAESARAAVDPGESLVLDAELQLSLARAHFQLGHTEQADRAFLDAANAAEASAYDELAATIWMELARVASVQKVDAQRADFYVERADAAVTRLGDPPRRRAVIEQRRAQNLIAAGRPDEALPLLRRAQQLVADTAGAERIRPAIAMDIGRVAYTRADYDAAIAAFEQVVPEYVAAYGAHHPTVADARHNLGTVLVAAGRMEAALPVLEVALEARKTAYGEQHEKVARTLNSIASIAFTQGRYAEALSRYRDVARMHRAARDGPHVTIAEAIANIGRAQTGLSDFAAADASFDEAATMLVGLVGEEHPRLADVLSGRAGARASAADPEAAARLYARVLQIRTAALGPEAPRTLRTEVDLANSERALGEVSAARARLLRVVAVPRLDPALAARASLTLAWIDVDEGDDDAARKRFEAGVEARKAAGDDAALDDDVRRARAWLVSHAPSTIPRGRE